MFFKFRKLGLFFFELLTNYEQVIHNLIILCSGKNLENDFVVLEKHNGEKTKKKYIYISFNLT